MKFSILLFACIMLLISACSISVDENQQMSAEEYIASGRTQTALPQDSDQIKALLAQNQELQTQVAQFEEAIRIQRQYLDIYKTWLDVAAYEGILVYQTQLWYESQIGDVTSYQQYLNEYKLQVTKIKAQISRARNLELTNSGVPMSDSELIELETSLDEAVTVFEDTVKQMS